VESAVNVTAGKDTATIQDLTTATKEMYGNNGVSRNSAAVSKNSHSIYLP
jgi:hypothetical protein